MHRLCYAVLAFAILTTRVAHAQDKATKIDFEDLLTAPIVYDGERVLIDAEYQMGFEGDNFLIGPLPNPRRVYLFDARVWFQCTNRELCKDLHAWDRGRGIFVGYFHYVAAHRPNFAFDPGPLQFEVTSFIRLPPGHGRSDSEAYWRSTIPSL